MFRGDLDLKYRTDIEMCDKYNLRASFTVETAAIFPVVFLVIVSAVYLSFFFHDKHILQSAVIETASIASERMRLLTSPETEELAGHLQERIRGKMIYFSAATVEIVCEEEKVAVNAAAYKRRMRIRADAVMNITIPEREVRRVRHFREVGE